MRWSSQSIQQRGTRIETKTDWHSAIYKEFIGSNRKSTGYGECSRFSRVNIQNRKLRPTRARVWNVYTRQDTWQSRSLDWRNVTHYAVDLAIVVPRPTTYEPHIAPSLSHAITVIPIVKGSRGHFIERFAHARLTSVVAYSVTGPGDDANSNIRHEIAAESKRRERVGPESFYLSSRLFCGQLGQVEPPLLICRVWNGERFSAGSNASGSEDRALIHTRTTLTHIERPPFFLLASLSRTERQLRALPAARSRTGWKRR